MKTENKAWLLFGVSTIGMLIFAGLYFLSPKDTVIGASKEGQKVKQVPAEIPNEYVKAFEEYEKMTHATNLTIDQILFKIKDVRVLYDLDKDVKEVLTEDEVTTKFELALRRNNVLCNPKSTHVISLRIGGFDDVTSRFCFAIICSLTENQWIWRDGDWHTAEVTVWTRGIDFGTVGRNKARTTILEKVEERAEIFANDFLSANPKSQ